MSQQHTSTLRKNQLIMSSNTFKALTYLQNYADASGKAHEEQKSCMWQLTKSRQNVRSGIIGVDSTTAYTAELLREELRAQIRVVDVDENGEIDLVNEDSTKPQAKDKGDLCTEVPHWKVYNVLSEREKAKRNALTDESSSLKSQISNSTESDGIRYRNKNNKKSAAAATSTSLDTSPSSSWTMVQEEDLNSDVEEEEKLIRTDPIKLFGGYFTARELKVAQRNARQSLNYYIQAANEAARLMEALKESKN